MVVKEELNVDSDDETELEAADKAETKQHEYGKNEKLVLKDILIEPGTCYREQLSEIVHGFPRVKQALNLRESVSEWNDSEGMNGSILDDDDEAFDLTDKTILNSYQNFLVVKHGSPKETKTGA